MNPPTDQESKNRKMLHDLQKTKQMMMKSSSISGSRLNLSAGSTLHQPADSSPVPSSTLAFSNEPPHQANRIANSMEMLQKSTINFWPTPNSKFQNTLLPIFPRLPAD